MPDPHETSGTPVDFDLARPLPKELPRAESSTGASSGPSGDPPPRIGIVFGSATDWPTMSLAVAMVDSFGVPCEYGVVSAHRTPDRLRDYARGARARGIQVIIAGAGGAAHLPGMIAAWTTLPVLGVPIRSRALHGVDSLLSIVQMPKGVPVGTLAIGDAGARNAALLALRMLGAFDDALAKRLEDKAALDARAALAAPLEGPPSGRLDP